MYQLTRGFSRQHRITEFTSTATHHLSHTMRHGFTYASCYRLTPRQPTAWPCYLPASPHRLTTTHKVPRSHTQITPKDEKDAFGRLVHAIRHWARIHGYGNINPLSIDYACRPRLRSRLTLGGLTWPRNPWSFGGRVSHSSFATHACILTRAASTPGSLRRFHGCTTLPYPSTPLHTGP